jgi:HD-GYP domain-containing protein (c-di-GMP phosphodiesterase class II)
MIENPRKIAGKYLDSGLVLKAAAIASAIAPVRLAVYDLEGKILYSSAFPAEAVAIPPQWLEAADRPDQALQDTPVVVNQDEKGTLCLVTPICVDEEPAAVLVGRVAGGRISGKQLETWKTLLESLAGFLAATLSGKRTMADLTHELSGRYEDLAVVYELGDMLRISRPPQDILADISTLITEALELDLVAVRVPDLGIEWVYPPQAAEDPSWRALARELHARADHARAAVVVNHLPEQGLGSGGFAHAMAAPFVVDDNPGGLFILRRNPKARFFTTETKLLEVIGRQVAVALTNARIVQTRIATHDTAIFVVARLAESRDPETGSHLERVQNYAQMTARHLSRKEKYRKLITPEYIEDIVRSSPLHDIGKVGIRDSILLKPGKLTPEEFEIMKSHTTIGGDTLRDGELRQKVKGDSFLTMGRCIAYSHHEKWNGTGYPKGLAGEDIPLSARIVALADVYDAVSSKRCYKDACSSDQTRRIIVEGSGTHFDPDVVEAFVEDEHLFREISIRLRETSELGEPPLAGPGPQPVPGRCA